MRNLEGNGHDASHARRRGRRVGVALLAMGFVACGGDASGPPAPGSILVKTETTGFFKPDGYQVVVDGGVPIAIGATDQVTVNELEPGSHQVTLTGVPDNCTTQGVEVAVESEATSEASLTVACTYAAPVSFTIQFSRERPDLDTDAITTCSFGLCPTDADWDLYVYNNTSTETHAVIRQNETAGVEIAHLPGVTLADMTEADVDGATFTTDLINDPFDAGRVILIRTDQGNVYALGNPSEDLVFLKLTFDAALLSTP